MNTRGWRLQVVKGLRGGVQDVALKMLIGETHYHINSFRQVQFKAPPSHLAIVSPCCTAQQNSHIQCAVHRCYTEYILITYEAAGEPETHIRVMESL